MRLVVENVHQFLRDELGTSEIIRIQAPQPTEAGNYILVQQQQGAQRVFPDNRQDPAVQVLFYFSSEFEAREKATNVFDILREQEHARVLPAANGITGSAPVTTSRIEVLSPPFYLGMVTRWHVYTLNLIVTYFP